MSLTRKRRRQLRDVLIKTLDNLHILLSQSPPDEVVFLWAELERVKPEFHAKLQRSFGHNEPWEDPQNGFGKMQTKLLDFLIHGAPIERRQVIAHLWPEEYTPSDEEQMKVLQARLRSLARSTNDRFYKLLMSNWRIIRSCKHVGYLELISTYISSDTSI